MSLTVKNETEIVKDWLKKQKEKPKNMDWKISKQRRGKFPYCGKATKQIHVNSINTLQAALLILQCGQHNNVWKQNRFNLKNVSES